MKLTNLEFRLMVDLLETIKDMTANFYRWPTLYGPPTKEHMQEIYKISNILYRSVLNESIVIEDDEMSEKIYKMVEAIRQDKARKEKEELKKQRLDIEKRQKAAEKTLREAKEQLKT